MLIRRREKEKLFLHCIPKYIFYFYAVCNQHIIEFYSFSFLLMFRGGFTVPTSLIFHKWANTPLLINSVISQPLMIIICILNMIGIVIALITTYVSFFILNSPFLLKKTSLRLRHKNYAIFITFLSVMYAIHYFEIFLTDLYNKISL